MNKSTSTKESRLEKQIGNYVMEKISFYQMNRNSQL